MLGIDLREDDDDETTFRPAARRRRPVPWPTVVVGLLGLAVGLLGGWSLSATGADPAAGVPDDDAPPPLRLDSPVLLPDGRETTVAAFAASLDRIGWQSRSSLAARSAAEQLDVYLKEVDRLQSRGDRGSYSEASTVASRGIAAALMMVALITFPDEHDTRTVRLAAYDAAASLCEVIVENCDRIGYDRENDPYHELLPRLRSLRDQHALLNAP